MAENTKHGSAIDPVQCPLNGFEGETAERERISSEKLMDVYFIRHTDDMDVDDSTRKFLWDNHLVGFHFPFDKEDQSRDN
jgi:hypothetical protein